MDYLVVALLGASGLASCAAVGGIIAYQKKRPPTEGLLLGLFLGPIGVAVEARRPLVRRPEVDERAWHSFRSVAAYRPGPPRGPSEGPAGPTGERNPPAQSSASSGSTESGM